MIANPTPPTPRPIKGLASKLAKTIALCLAATTLSHAQTVQTLFPENNGTPAAAGDLTMQITYDVNVSAGAGSVTVTNLDTSATVETFDITNPADATVSGNTVTFRTFTAVGGSQYNVEAPEGFVIATEGGSPAPGFGFNPGDGIWIFDVVAPDTTGPAVVSLSPQNGPGASVASTLSVTYDENVSLGAGPWSITVFDVTGNQLVETFTEADTTSVDALGTRLSFTLASNLAFNNEYRVTASAGLVEDSAGNLSAEIASGEWQFTTGDPFTRGQVVISQVYGGGGNAGATLKNDFVELHNLTDSVISLTGWSVQYARFDGSNWSVTELSGAIQPGGYFLVQQAAEGGGTQALPAPDVSGETEMGASSGKVALSNSITPLEGTDPTSDPSISDFVGYGSANAFEGTGATPALSNTTAALRLGNGSVDTDDNAADFETNIEAKVPNPRNSDSPPFFPTGDGSGIASAVNAGGAAGTLSNLPLFVSAGSGQTLAVTVTGTFDETLTDVVVELPSDFSAPLMGNITLSGPASGGASAMVSGQTITVSDAAVTIADSLTVTISGLTVPDASAVLEDSGARTIGVLTAEAGGTLTSIVSPPVVTAVVPVATVAALRAQPNDGLKTYLLNTEVVVTYATPGFRNQHWVQDSTAGIVIDDQPGVLTPFAEGSGVSGLVGKLVVFNGLVELQPSYNAGELTSSGNDPAPVVVSLADLIADPISYQARLVRVNDVVFARLPDTFGRGIEHPIALAADELVKFNLRSFFDTDYENTPLPATELDLVGLIQTRNATSFISPRKLADIITGLPPVDPGSPLATWDFTGALGEQASQPVNTTATGLTAGDVTRGSGLTASAAGNSISSSGWSTGALDADDYYEFSITINAATTATLNSIAFAERRSGSGIRDFALRSSLDGYTSDIAAINVQDNTSTRQQNIILPVSFEGLTDTTVTFRIYGYNAEGSGGTWRIANSAEFGGLVVLGTTSTTGGGYDAWSDLYAGNGAADEDFNNDGVPNAVAYFFGAETAGFVPTPGIENGSITFPRDASLTDVTFEVQTSGDLVVWDDVLVEDLDLSDPNSITYVLPDEPAPFFVRIAVFVTSPAP